MPEQGDILLVPIPFTDLSSQKRRPVKGTLNHPGKVRADKIYTISKSIVVKTFGRVKEETLKRIRQEIQDLTATKSK